MCFPADISFISGSSCLPSYFFFVFFYIYSCSLDLLPVSTCFLPVSKALESLQDFKRTVFSFGQLQFCPTAVLSSNSSPSIPVSVSEAGHCFYSPTKVNPSGSFTHCTVDKAQDPVFILLSPWNPEILLLNYCYVGSSSLHPLPPVVLLHCHFFSAVQDTGPMRQLWPELRATILVVVTEN